MIGAIGAAGLLPAFQRRNDKATPEFLQKNEVSLKDKFEEVRNQINTLSELITSLENQYEVEVTRLASTKSGAEARSFGFSEDRGHDEHRKPATKAPTFCRKASGHNLTEGEEQLFEAIDSGTADEVRQLLDANADPNMEFHDFTCINKDFKTGTPVAIATLKARKDLVDMLVQRGADPDSTYSFCAGAEQKIWSGSAINATIPGGKMDMLKALVELRADMHSVGSNGANLVWQAAYFGKKEIMEYLIDSTVDANLPARSQDDANLSYTPLHAAAVAGHLEIVQKLIQKKVSIDTDDGGGRTALDDAVMQGHQEVVRLLVKSQADIFNIPVPRRLTRRGSHGEISLDGMKQEHMRCLDRVFCSGNPALLEAVASGLREAKTTLDFLDKEDLIRFLRSPGEAPCLILGSIFQRHKIQYWDDDGDKRLRVMRNVAYVGEDDTNVTSGPHARVTERAFANKVAVDSKMKAFYNALVPGTPPPGPAMLVPVHCYMSHVPFLHKDLGVLLSIADCKHPKIFEQKGCQAIINLKWTTERFGARFRMVMALVEVLNLVFINLVLNNTELKLHKTARLVVLTVLNILAIAVWLVALFLEVSQAVGYFDRGLHRRYLRCGRYWFDIIVVGSTAYICFYTAAKNLEVTEKEVFKVLLGVIIFLKWIRFLMFMRQLRHVGVHILPIITTMWDVGPFLAVLAVYMLGSVNMYYSITTYDLWECFILIYRLVVLGDMELWEMENVYGPRMFINTADFTGPAVQSEIFQDLPEKTPYYDVVRLMMVVISFIMGLSMMNLFVAMLCLSYSQAWDNSWNAFLQSRAVIVLDQTAIRLGIRRMFCSKRSANGSTTTAHMTEGHSASALLDQDALDAFVWYAEVATANT